MDAKNKVAFVTGSSTGIGKAIAIRLAEEGFDVVVNCKESVNSAKSVVKNIKSLGKRSLFIQADLSRLSEVKRTFEQIHDTYGRLDVLVNNASKQGATDFVATENEDWDAHYRNDLLSTVMCCREFVKMNMLLGTRVLRKIVNISSLYGIGDKSNESFMPYSVAKAGVNNFTQNLARLVAPDVLVNAIAPGYVYTGAWEGVNDEDLDESKKQTIIKRFIKPDEIADATMFLINNDAVTGQILVVDGGLGLR